MISLVEQTARSAFGKYCVRGAMISMLALAPFCVIAEEATADKAIEIVRTGIAHDAIYALDMNGEKGIAIGNYGLMLETKDGGATWTSIEPVTKQALFGISTAGDRQLIVGQSGIVLTRVGDGKWEELENDIELRLLNCALSESGLAFAVGEFGAILRSRDAGKTWERIEIDWSLYNDEGYEPHMYDVAIKDDQNIAVVGEFGLVLWSEDGGDTFVARHQGEESLFDIMLNADGTGTGYAVGQNGEVLRSQDDGMTWQKLEAGPDANLLGARSGQGEVVAVGIRELLRSSDDGNTWKRATDPQVVRTWYQGIDAGVTEIEAPNGFLRTQIVYIGGYNGTISRVLE